MKLTRRWRFMVCLLCLIAVLGYSFSALAVTTSSGREIAEDEDDNGEVFVLNASSVRNGSKDVPLDVTIQLDFNKNVVNVAVLQSNITCYHLTTRDGASVPIRIIMPDDQLQRTYKRNVFIQPQAELSPNTEYTLSVDAALTAKNGTVLNQYYDINFKTGTSAKGETNAILTELGDNIVAFESNLPVPQRQPTAEPEDQAPEETVSESFMETLSIVLVVVILAVLVAVTVLRLVHCRQERGA